MQHKPDIGRCRGAIKQFIVRCTKKIFAPRWASAAASLVQGPTSKLFNFFCFRADFDWTGATVAP
jgi:hypothetical protein